MSHPLTPEATAAAIDRLRPVLASLLAQPDVGRDGLALSIACEDVTGTPVELGDFTIGDLSSNPYPNGQIARQKRGLSQRKRMAGAMVPSCERDPERDSAWTGSAWISGVAVGCAGLTEAQDGLVAHWVAHALLCEAGMPPHAP
ncbi:hypothetical protein [Oceanicola sp. S124]|uniref:hypothetical protein n=1 Tax=Oceanicola sp. S124 TaxID=1042378 RepID=UPI00025584E3|nr:hypothetical protein [Oceanicola sp. S124]